MGNPTEQFQVGVKYETSGDNVLRLTYWDPKYDDAQHGIVILINFNLPDDALERIANMATQINKGWADVMMDVQHKVQSGELRLRG